MVARSWRPYAAPAAFLAAVTIAVVGVRMLWPHHAAKATHTSRQHAKSKPTGPLYYRVRAGDTLAAIATRTHTSVARLHTLNPAVQPTALFIGQRLHLR